MNAAEGAYCAVDGCAIPDRHVTSCHGDECRGCLPGLAADHMLLCRHHYRRAVLALHELPELDEALILASARGGSTALTERVSSTPEHGIKLNEDALATKDSLREDLSLFASYLIVELGLAPLRSQTTSDMVSIIDRHSLALASDPVTAKAFAVKIVSARDDACRHAYPDKQTSLRLCACAECGRAIRYTRDDATIRCRGCHTTHTLAALEQAQAPLNDARFTSRELSLYLASRLGRLVPESTIRRWASEGRLPRHGKDRRQRVLYNPLEALAVAEQVTS